MNIKLTKKQKKLLYKYAITIIIIALAVICGLGLWTLFFAVAAIISIPAVFSFIRKKTKVNKFILGGLVFVLVFVGLIFFSNTDGRITKIAQDNGLIESTTGISETKKANSSKSSKTKFKSSDDIKADVESVPSVSSNNIPSYNGDAYIVVDNNLPSFSENEKKNKKSFEKYSNHDTLGRCSTAYANVCKDTMPKEKRGSISEVKPSGWVSCKYDFVDGQSLYNRCHLIGFQLTAENANEKNLITGTRYMNTQGMLPFENMVADYVKETGNHVLYRVTPVYKNKELVARGVQMEAYSVEDNGDGICFNVYCFNIQPGVIINYANGISKSDGTLDKTTAKPVDNEKNQVYILNNKSKKFHYPDCKNVKDISKENKSEYKGRRTGLINRGYEPCGSCNP